MDRLVKHSRLVALTVLLLMLIAAYVAELYKLQIVEGADYYAESQDVRTLTEIVPAARGNIYDRYGRELVSNRECYNIQLDTDKLFADTVEDPNAIILQMVRTVQEYGGDYIDELPITKSPPFEYTEMSDIQRMRVEAYLEDKSLPKDTTAVELMSYFRTRYNIDNNYTSEEMRIIAGIRYELNVRYAINTSAYVFVEDASIDLISTLMSEVGGIIDVKTSFVREYSTQYAAHILGYIGLMNDLEYAKYRPDKENSAYGYDSKVGKDGIELTCEEYLHGVDGEAVITKTSNGTVISTVYTEDPVPGNHVYLTIDVKLQEATERALESGVQELQRLRELDNHKALTEGRYEDVKEDVGGAAAVAVNVKTGEPLAIASYPTYSLENIITDYSEILAEENNPLFNRALLGAYAPGSTFKPCTAIACLSENVINTETRIKDQGYFTKYEYAGYAPTCWIVQDGALHGNENVTDAIRDSCNYFFYTVGDNLGISKLREYAEGFGLGESTGIELTETTGNMANPDNHEYYAGKSWTYGDTLQASIGQSDSMFTPLQLAEYCAAVANGGTRHSASIIKSVRTYDYSELLYKNENEVLSTVQSADYNWAAVQRGMLEVSNSPLGSAYSTFFGYSYGGQRINVASKTGTAQMGEERTNNAIFMCYAPYEDPEIAVAVVIEAGQAGSNCCKIARDILDAYFSLSDTSNTVERENTLLK